MKTYLDCIPCFFHQALQTSRMVTTDEGKVRRVLDEVGAMLKDLPLDKPPPENGRLVYKKIAEITGNPDPFKGLKKKYTQVTLKLYPSLKRMVVRSEDRLLTAIRLAIAGNVIDFGARSSLPQSHGDFDLEREVEEVLGRGFGVLDYENFRESLLTAPWVLYIGDNAGETVFDRILIEEMGKPVTYVVRGKPIINDATYEDAVEAGIHEVAKILSSGVDAPGTILGRCSDEFRRAYDSALLVISKGQGNYETLCGEKRPIFYMLKVKCPVIAREIGVEEGDIILKEVKAG